MKKLINILAIGILILTQLLITNHQPLVFAGPPRVKYKDRFTVDRSPFSEEKTKGVPVISQEKPEIKIALVPKKLSPHFSEFQVEGEITNAEITRVSFRLFGKVGGVVRLEIKEIDFSTEGLEKNIIFYRGYDLTCPVGGIKGGKIYFRVPKSWLGEKNVSPEKVSLRYYAKDEITPLLTEKISEDENYIYFLSKSEKLGIFLIFAEPLTPPSPTGGEVSP
jgi:hypothetical protein